MMSAVGSFRRTASTQGSKFEAVREGVMTVKLTILLVLGARIRLKRYAPFIFVGRVPLSVSRVFAVLASLVPLMSVASSLIREVFGEGLAEFADTARASARLFGRHRDLRFRSWCLGPHRCLQH